jgi:cellulase/cellobiase CelA1
VTSSLSATVRIGARWEQGYVASVRVQNTGKTSRAWTVRVTHADAEDDLALRGTWNATGRQSGDTMTFTGGPLAPGATAMFGYQVSGDARPSHCTVVGGKCSVS